MLRAGVAYWVSLQPRRRGERRLFHQRHAGSRPRRHFVQATFEEEPDLAWHNITAIAEAAGYTVTEIVYVQCVLADIGHYADINDWWRQQFPDISTAPARFTFQAAALPFGAKIEIQAVAARGI
jgi:2-iminobutanoate/2-iminopropanoate deaminase